jgi:hypothetical protein
MRTKERGREEREEEERGREERRGYSRQSIVMVKFE